MKNVEEATTLRQGLIVAINLFSSNPGMPDEEDQSIPYSSQKTEESTGLSPDREGVENLPPNQPDVHPLERENPDINEIEENRPDEQPDTDPMEAPVPDLDEIDPDTDREIDTDYMDEEEEAEGEDNIDRDPNIQPGTDPMKTDNSQII